MKSIIRRIDVFCAKHPRFGIPNLMMFVVIGNVAVYLFTLMDTTNTLRNLLYFSAERVLQGQVWRLITFVLVPNSTNILFMAISLYFYYFIGNTLERMWGSGKFTIYYFAGVLLMLIYGFVLYFAADISFSMDAYYLNMSMFFAFATFFPETRVLLFFIIPIKIKWLAIADAVYFAVMVVLNPFPVNLLPAVAVLNYLIFCGGWLFDFLRPSRIKRSASQRARTINYRQAAKKVRKEQRGKPYNRKCEVCGKTDTDYPNMEFRYCSKCQGYHCFCQDHINSHVHFTQ